MAFLGNLMNNLGKLSQGLATADMRINRPEEYARSQELLLRQKELQDRANERLALIEQEKQKRQALGKLGAFFGAKYGVPAEQVAPLLEGGVEPSVLGNLLTPEEIKLAEVYDPSSGGMRYVPQAQALGKLSQAPAKAEPRRIIEQNGVQYFADTGQPVIANPVAGTPEAQSAVGKAALDLRAGLITPDQFNVIATGEKPSDVQKREQELASGKESIDASLAYLKGIESQPGFEAAVGAGVQKTILNAVPWGDKAGDIDAVGGGFTQGSEAASFAERLKQVQGGAFLNAIQYLKGFGSVTQVEGEKATKAFSRMSLAQKESEFIKARDDYVANLEAGRAKIQKHLSKNTAQPTIPIIGSTPKEGQEVLLTDEKGRIIW